MPSSGPFEHFQTHGTQIYILFLINFFKGDFFFFLALGMIFVFNVWPVTKKELPLWSLFTRAFFPCVGMKLGIPVSELPASASCHSWVGSALTST